MSTTSQLTTFSDLFVDLENRVRVQTGVTATQDIAKRFINIALHDMHLGVAENYPWAERRAVLNTHDDYTTGTLAVTRGDTALTGTSTEWNTNDDFGVANVRAGGKIRIDGAEEVYEIASVSSNTAAVLTSDMVQATVTAATYSYFEDEYALETDFLRPVDQQRFTSGGLSIDLISRTEFRRRYPQNEVPGRPVVGTLIDLTFGSNTTPVRRLKLHPPPDDYYQIHYAYVTANLAVSSAGVEQANLSADADEPIVPLRYRHAILFHALAHYYRDRKDDQRSQDAANEYTKIMLRVTGDIEIGGARPQIRPRISQYMRRAKRPWSGGRGRFDLGNFDELGR